MQPRPSTTRGAGVPGGLRGALRAGPWRSRAALPGLTPPAANGARREGITSLPRAPIGCSRPRLQRRYLAASPGFASGLRRPAAGRGRGRGRGQGSGPGLGSGLGLGERGPGRSVPLTEQWNISY